MTKWQLVKFWSRLDLLAAVVRLIGLICLNAFQGHFSDNVLPQFEHIFFTPRESYTSSDFRLAYVKLMDIIYLTTWRN